MRMLNRSRKRRQLHQVVTGFLALPLSALPFVAYGNFTAEGRLVRDQLAVAVSPPELPELTEAQRLTAEQAAPHYQGKVMALVYHGVGTHAGGSDGEGGFVVSPGRFGAHLATLRAAGMHTVTAADVARTFATGKPLPDNAVMISFDDGRNDAVMWADPLLKQAQMKATMFVISGAASDPGIYYAGWKRLRAAARSGRWDIQAHTHASHQEQKVGGGWSLPLLTSLAPGESISNYRRRIARDLEKNSTAILTHIGRRPVAFAYPFGAYGAERTNDLRIRAVLREEIANRFVVAFHQDEQDSIPLVEPSQERVSLRRLEVGNWTGPELLELIDRAVTVSHGDGDPLAVSPPVVRRLPPIPFLSELHRDPAPIPPETRFRPRPRPGAPVPVAVPAPAANAPAATVPTTATTTGPTTASGPPATTTPTTTTTGKPSPTTTTTTRPPPTTTTTRKPTVPTTTTTRPPPTTTTTRKPTAPTTTTTRPPTTTTTACIHVNGKPCHK